MVIGTKDPEVIAPDHYQALLTSSAILIDEFMEDVADINEHDWNIATTLMFTYLPPSYLHRFPPIFARQFLIATSTVAWKLAQDKYYLLDSVAEELALRAIIEHAPVTLESAGIPASDDDYEAFIDIAYEDLDHELLFDMALDGLQDAGDTLRIENWFAPFRGKSHPYLTDDDPLIDRRNHRSI